MPKILLVDDDPGIREVVTYSLQREGFEVDDAADGEAALEKARDGGYDVVILDVMLPAISGTDVCRQLRAESNVPILMLTAKDAEVDRVLGLELGADDYVGKPFSTVERSSSPETVTTKASAPIWAVPTRAATTAIGGEPTARALSGV